MKESTVESSTEAVLNVARTERIRVLHVDDDQAFLKVAKQCLEMQGEIDVDTVSSVNEASEKLKKTDYDAVVCDYQMPGKDGLEFLKELRAGGNTIPFIIFTGKGREEIAIRALNLGADQYVDKHGDPETVYCELAHAIRQAVDRNLTQVESLKREVKLRAILESSPEAITIVDLNGTIIDCNQATLDVHGYTSKSEVIGKHSFNLVSEKDHKRALEDMKRILEHGSFKNMEYTATRKDGSEFPVELSGSVFRDPSRNPIGFASIAKDVTERNKTEEALHASMESYRELTESISDVFFAMDKDFRYIYWNKASEKLTGISAKDAIGKSLTEVFPDVKGTRMEQVYRETLRTQQPQSYLNKYQLKGKDYVFEINACPTKAGLSVFVKDITERKGAEEKLVYWKEFNERVVDSIGDPLLIINPSDHAIISANEAALKQLKSRKEDLIGKTCYETTHHRSTPCTLPHGVCPIPELLKIGKPVTVEHQYVDEDNNRISVEVTVHPVKDKEGKTVQVVHIAKDITERKNAEKALEESKESFRAIFEGAGDGIIGADVKTKRFFFANPRICEITGYSLEELLKLGVGDLHAKKDLPYVIDSFTKQMQGKLTLSKDIPVLRKDERVVYCDVNSKPIKIGSQEYLVGFFRDVSERKNTEDKLRESEEKYRNLVELAPDGIMAVNAEGIITSANRSFLTLVGYDSEEEVVGKPFAELVTIQAEDIPRFQEMFSSLMNGKPLSPVEFLYARKDGTSRWAEVHPSLLVEDGNPVGAQVIMRDVTERKKAEEALRETKDYLDNLLNYANAPIIVWDNEQKIALFNNAFEALTGYKKESMLGRNIDALFPPLQKAKILQTIEAATRGEKWQSVEVPILCKDKETMIVLWNSANVTNKDGDIVATIAQGQDITERKALEDALQDAKQKWTSLTENTDDIVMIVDTEGVIQYINRTIPPHTPEGTIGKTVYEYVPREQHDTMRSSLAKTFETGVPLDYVVSSNIPKIGTMWFETKIVPVKDDEKTVSVILISADITELKNTEERLKETNMKLVVTNEKLHVVGGLARHDVRNKLVAVTGNAYLLKQRLSGDAKALGQLNEMEAAVRLVEKIFEFARIYEKLGVEQLTSIDVGKAVDGAVSLFSGLKGVKMVNECRGLTVLADSLLSQLFYNLIDNSLKYGEKTRQIKVYCKTSSSNQLELVYEDDGVGIPDNVRSNLFKEGFTSGKGTGYGLFMIKRICEVYGWTISETGTQGKGARFILTVPQQHAH